MSHRVKPGSVSTTPAPAKDFWRTDPVAVQDAEHLLGQPLLLDAAAEAGSEACHFFITPEQDALKTEWNDAIYYGNTVWCNPPFTQKEVFLARAKEQADRHKLTVCCMIPYEPTTGWWRECVRDQASIVYRPDGRYNYVNHIAGELMSGCHFVSCFVVFTPMTMPTITVDYERGISQAGGAA